MTNPLLSELDSLSPGAKSALLAAHASTQAPPVNQGMAAPVAPTHIAPPVDTPPPTLGGAPQMNAAPSPSLMGGSAAPPSMASLGAGADAGLGNLPAPPKAVAAPRGTLMGDQDERNRLISSGSGIHQIENPWLKGLATAGNIIGGAVAPGLMQAIPGTEQHHNLLLNQANAAVGQDVGKAEKQAQTLELGEQTKQREALAEQEQAKAQSLLHPEQHQKEEKPENLQQNYSDAVADAIHRGVDPSTDQTVQYWGNAIQGIQPEHTAKAENKDDRAIALDAKAAMGQKLTPEESAYMKAYDKYIDKNKVAPGVARMQVLMQSPIAVADPNNPGGLVYSTRRGAIGQGAPGGIETQVPLNVAKSFTAGPNAATLTNINTADSHIQQLAKIAKSLNNGDLTDVNKLANTYKEHTGEAAPLNFQLLKTALAAEIGKTTTGGVATVEETKELTKALNASNSPEQIQGVMAQAQKLMHSKRDQLHAQYNQGMQGQANFNAPNENAGQFSVKAPNGKTYKFPDQNAADTFKRNAGIR